MLSQVTISLSNELHGILYAIVFLLVAIQGYLQSSPLVAGHEYLAMFILLLPGIIAILKVLAGPGQPGILTPTQAKILMYLAMLLTAAGFAASGITLDPNFLLVAGLLGAVAAGLRGFLGTQALPAPIQTIAKPVA